MITTSPVVSTREFEEGTGWKLEPAGACKGDICIPLPARNGEHVDIRQMAEVMRLPLLRDETHDVWVLGPEASTEAVRVATEAAELVLPDVDGNEFRLSSLRGTKVVVVAWAPY